MQYNWNGEGLQDSDTYQVDSSFGDDPLSLVVSAQDGNSSYEIELEAVNFIWQGASIN